MIRDAGLSDIVRLMAAQRQQRTMRLNPPYTIIQPETMLVDLLRAQNPLPTRRCHTLVDDDGRDIRGYVQARCRWQRSDEWTVTTLGSSRRDSAEVWGPLVEELVHQAGDRGIVRVFAKLPVDDEHLAIFKDLGFLTYAHESVWGNLLLNNSGRPAAGPLRPQRDVDSWNLMQLYRAVTPRVVQQAEALTSKQWQIGSKFAPGGLKAQGFVWDGGSAADGAHPGVGLGGWIRLLSGSKGHWITTLFRPESRAMLPGALDYILWLGQKTAPKPMYAALREYQSEAESALSERGFHLLSEQALLVKYTAVLARQEAPAFALSRAQKLVVSDW